jgi:thiol-disulfide isomerase/thioredoxin
VPWAADPAVWFGKEIHEEAMSPIPSSVHVLLPALLVSLWLPASTRAEGPWLAEYEEAQAIAQRDGKDLLIDFGGSDWCAPCQLLKTSILSQPEFSDRAARHFVLVDIDDLHRKPMPAGRKERYKKLQERYGIEAFPTVVLATADGRPYARTTYHPAITTPGAYWEHLQPLRQRGTVLRAALEKAARLEGSARAAALADGLAEVPADFVPRFYEDRVQELRRLDPEDGTGYLAFHDGRKALAALQAKVEKGGLPALELAALDTLIKEMRLRGETLQEALLLRALAQAKLGRPQDALQSFEALLVEQSRRSRFDRGDFVPLDAAAIETVAKRIALGQKDPADTLAQYHALHRMFEFEFPDPNEICCGHGFRPKFLARGLLGETYGQLLIDSTAKLQGEARARALGQGLEGTGFWRQGPIAQIVDKLVPELVGREAAAKYLPEPYRGWVRR